MSVKHSGLLSSCDNPSSDRREICNFDDPYEDGEFEEEAEVEGDNGWTPKLENELRYLLRSLKPWQVCVVLRSQNDDWAALKFFYWDDRQWRYRHDSSPYRGGNMVRDAEGRSLTQFIDDAIHLISEMPSKGCLPDQVSYYTVMGFLYKEKRVKEVRELMEKMLKDNKLLPDHVTYNTLIHMLSKRGYGDDAVEFLKEAEERGFLMDKVGYSAIIHSFCQEGRIDRAKELVREMLSKGWSSDIVTHTAVSNGLCHVGEVDEARKLPQQMYKDGCRPNTVSYTAFLNRLHRSEKSSETRQMMNLSEEEWWTSNAITYSIVMHELRREEELSEALDLVKEMVNRGFYPTAIEMNLLIQSLCQVAIINALGKKGRIEEATELIKKIHKGLIPSVVMYQSVSHRFCQQGRAEDLLKLLEKMLSRQKCRTAYNQLIEMLCSFGNLDEAYKLLGTVLRTVSRIDANTCHMLMQSYLSKGSPLLSYKMACRMFNRNLTHDLKLCEKVRKRLMLGAK
ncbi:Pentatricopeptide repeat-containing protein [Actinidia chinensis var. chinensis]|uniref:Pentatricopeptide repeat-containing protein n=1 Tax=Actinidia chinensis var. chinensis TaxID=1590841 RepID=A0A2R6Q5I1_ACTCC|nr:Pentatricopeptide repeat-containing protein [Actinidia chinensis var. chinensis]